MKNSKWIIIILSTIFLIAFNWAIEKKDLFNRAIVVGLGIGEDRIIIQYLKEDKYQNIEVKADKISKMEEMVNSESGLIVSLNQCIVIVLEEGTNYNEKMEDVLFNTKITPNTILVATKDINELFYAKVESAKSPAFLVEKIMLGKKDTILFKDYFEKRDEKNKLDIPLVKIENGALIKQYNLKLDFA